MYTGIKFYLNVDSITDEERSMKGLGFTSTFSGTYCDEVAASFGEPLFANMSRARSSIGVIES